MTPWSIRYFCKRAEVCAQSNFKSTTIALRRSFFAAESSMETAISVFPAPHGAYSITALWPSANAARRLSIVAIWCGRSSSAAMIKRSCDQ